LRIRKIVEVAVPAVHSSFFFVSFVSFVSFVFFVFFVFFVRLVFHACSLTCLFIVSKRTYSNAESLVSKLTSNAACYNFGTLIVPLA
jgi:hypothetical protein